MNLGSAQCVLISCNAKVQRAINYSVKDRAVGEVTLLLRVLPVNPVNYSGTVIPVPNFIDIVVSIWY